MTPEQVTELSDAIAIALQDIFDETENSAYLDDKSYYEKVAKGFEYQGKNVQISVKLILDEKSHLDEDEIYWKDKDEDEVEASSGTEEEEG